MNFTKKQLHNLFNILSSRVQQFQSPASDRIVELYGRDAFFILVFCILSLRTRDAVTLAASKRLFSVAKTVQEIASIDSQLLSKIIYPVGFYKRKATQLILCAQKILKKFHGKIPQTESALLSLPGVGRKTMNLVRQEGFLLPALCVDTHVHRIANKIGLIHTKTPQETEKSLKQLLPKSSWRKWNRVLLIWGQQVCPPRKHQCDRNPKKHA